jgi:hypothetical protein
MSRLKQSQNMDRLILSIETITKSQCSLSDQDLTILNEAIEKLQLLKMKKGRTNEQVLIEIADVLVLLTKYFVVC